MIKWCPKCREDVRAKVRESLIPDQKITEYHCPDCNQFLGSEIEYILLEWYYKFYLDGKTSNSLRKFIFSLAGGKSSHPKVAKR